MTPSDLDAALAALPKAELHLHLEGAIAPATLVELAARHAASLSLEEAAARYEYADFAGFLEAFKWVASWLRAPADYALIAERLAAELRRQNVVYAEVTLAVGVMLRRRQDVEANFAALRDAAAAAQKHGLRLAWVFDTARQFGTDAAMEVARCASRMKSAGVVAFGMGGDELALPAADFAKVYDYVAGEGLHRLVHAGEVGGPQAVFDALEPLGAERIGHGIAAMHDRGLMEWLATWRIPLEVCPTSNLRTGALARQVNRPTARLQDHPLKLLFDRGLRVTLSSDDPAMFHTTLTQEYSLAARLGFSPAELARLARASFEAAFLPEDEKQSLLDAFDTQAKSLP